MTKFVPTFVTLRNMRRGSVICVGLYSEIPKTPKKCRIFSGTFQPTFRNQEFIFGDFFRKVFSLVGGFWACLFGNSLCAIPFFVRVSVIATSD